MNRAYLSIGTNLGNRKNNIETAITLLKALPDTSVVKVSKIYETEPWGYTNQDKFLNVCVLIETGLNPKELLYKCQDIENELKRVRDVRWGPRTIDVDILLYDDIISEDESLIIPHPRIHERAFVLIPLRDLDKDIIIKNQNMEYWISKLDPSEVKEYVGDE